MAGAEETSALGRAELLRIARLARKANRVPDMFFLVNKMAVMHFEFNSEERSILVIAYGGTFSPKIEELRVISALAEGEGEDPDNAESVMFYLGMLEDDMQALCREALDIVEEHLLPFSHDAENIALYTMMKGDTYWILAMLKKEKDKKLLVHKALKAYKAASDAAESLSAAHPQRLAVTLTKTAFYFDVMELPKLATALAKLALENAGPELASLDDESYKKSLEIMGLMEDNLKLWKKATSPQSEDSSQSETENNIISFTLASLSLDKAGPSYTNGSPSPPPPPPSPPVIPRSADSESETENNIIFFTLAMLSLDEAGPSYTNGPLSPPPPPPSPPVIPRSADSSESETENNIISFPLASLSLDEAGPSYTNGSPSPPPPPPSPPVIPRSADYSENENNTSFQPASLEASNGSPSPPPPVVPLSAGPQVAPSEFISPGDWGYEFHDGLSPMEIRSRKKAAQINRGRMG